jgi:hypothetical protein
VEDQQYVWMESMIDPQYTLITVWLEGDAYRTNPIFVRCRFDEPWLQEWINSRPEHTPYIHDLILPIFRPELLSTWSIGQMIVSARKLGWQPEYEAGGRHYDLLISGDLREVDNATVPGDDPFGLRLPN